MDGNIPQHYEVKNPGGMLSPQEQLNNQIEEQKKIIIKGMDDDLKSGGKYEEIKNDLKYEVIGNIGVVIYKGVPNSWYKYGKNSGVEYYTNLDGTFTDDNLAYASRDSGYQVNNGKLFRNGQEIPQFLGNEKITPEFVKGIDNLNFYEDIQLVYGSIKTIESNGKLKEVDINDIYTSIVSGVARIKDIMYFAGKGYIPNDDVLKLLKRAIQELPNQCSDIRFYQTAQGVRMGMEVTKDELDQYLKPEEGEPLITQSMYDDCLKRIELRDKKIAELNGVKEESKTDRKIEGVKNGFIDRIKGVLDR